MPSKKTSRQEILLKSLQVFREKGYHQTSISDLRVACGIQHNANFYYYFSSKEQLLEEVLRSVHQYFEKKINGLAFIDELSPSQRMKKMTHSLQKAFSIGKGGCIMANIGMELAQTHPSLIRVIRQHFDDLIDALTYLLNSQYPESEARELAQQIVQDIEGSVMLMQLYNDEQYLIRSLERANGHIQ